MSVVESQANMPDLLPCNAQCGADYDNYSFGQSDKEVTITVPLEKGTSSKQLAIDISTSSLSLGLKGKEPILQGKLYKPIKASESTWYLDDNKDLVVLLVKTNLKYEEWWPHVVEGERQLDMKTLNPPAIHVSELDDGAQAKVAKMMHEQGEKRKNGLM